MPADLIKMILTLILEFQIFSAGDNRFGKLGQGVDPNIGTTPVEFAKIELEEDVSKFNIGSNHVVAITKQGDLYAWGSNSDNQLLTGEPANWTRPEIITYFKTKKLKVLDADAGATHTIVLANDGAVYLFGRNSAGQLGVERSSVGETKDSPVKITMKQDECEVSGVSAELETSYIICSNGLAYVFGSCQQYKCGDGALTTAIFEKPTRMNITFKVAEIISGNDTMFVKDKDGNVWVIGANQYGELCVGTKNDTIDHFARVEALQHVKWISSGKRHTIVLMGQDVYGCGSNFGHEFFEGEPTQYYTPTLAATGVEATSATSMGTLIVKDGDLIGIGESAGNPEWSELGILGYHQEWVDVPEPQLVRHIIAFGQYSFAFEEYTPMKKGLSGWAIAGIVIAVLLVVAGLGFAIWWFCFKNRDIFEKSYNEVNANLVAEADAW